MAESLHDDYDIKQGYDVKQGLLPTLSLLTSLSTLVCCALPALLVTLGAGAALASLVSMAPWLVALSKYKLWTFTLSAILIVFAGLMRWRSRYEPCPLDPERARACARVRVISRWVYWLSVLLWGVGFFFAFLAIHLMEALGN